MSYHELSELARDLGISNNSFGKESKTNQLSVKNAVDEVFMTDTDITMLWIVEILKVHRTKPLWNTAYQYWSELHQIFRNNEDDQGTTNTDGKIQQQIKIQNKIILVARAVQNIAVTRENFDAALLLTCTLLGLYRRWGCLDEGQLDHLGYGWLNLQFKKVSNAEITRRIINKTGKNRQKNFSPVYNAIIYLINKSPLLRDKIPLELAPKIDTPCEEQKAANIPKSIDKNNFEHDTALKKSKAIEHEIKICEEKITENNASISQVKNYLDYFYNKITDQIKIGKVIRYDEKLAVEFELTEEEKKDWIDYAQFQEKNYLDHFLNSINRIIVGSNKSAEETMQPLLIKINDKMDQIQILLQHIEKEKEHVNELKQQKLQIDNLIHANAKHLLAKDSKHPTIAPPAILKNNHKQYELSCAQIAEAECTRIEEIRIVKTPWWKRILLDFAGMSLGTAIGYAIGFVVGTILGILSGGIGAIICLPLSIAIGAFLGAVIGGCLTDANLASDKNTQSEDSVINDDMIENPIKVANASIEKKLSIKPEKNPKVRETKPGIEKIKPIQSLSSYTHTLPEVKYHFKTR